MDKKTLQSAYQQGLLSEDQIEPLFDFFTKKPIEITANGSNEKLPLIRSFSDVFISLGIAFMAIAASQFKLTSYFSFLPVLFLIATTEWLTHSRKLSFSGIVLLLSMLYFISQVFGFTDPSERIISTLLLTGSSFAFYFRYQLPFAIVPSALGLIALTILLAGFSLDTPNFLTILYGLSIFAIAMYLDSNNPKRDNWLSDSAFWLHLLAAPLIVHGVMLVLLSTDVMIILREIFIILFFIFFVLTALFVDRRALLISSLSYAIYAIIQLGHQNAVEDITLFTFMGFGGFIVIFGTYWHKARFLIFYRMQHILPSRHVPEFRNG